MLKEKGLNKKVVGAVVAVALSLAAIFAITSKDKVKNYVLFEEPKEVIVDSVEYDYYYYDKLNDLKADDTIEYDENKPLTAQFLREDISYDDYLKTHALDRVRENHSVLSYIDKKDNTWVPMDLDEYYKEFVEELKKEKDESNFKGSFSNYLKERFGKNITEERLKEIYTKDKVRELYLSDFRNSINKDSLGGLFDQYKNKLMAKKYMYYDLHFNNLDEKEILEEKAFEIFDSIIDEQSFVDVIKAVDVDVQEKIKKENYSDEQIKEDYTNIINANDKTNFTKDWLYSSEDGEEVEPGSLAILVNKAGEKNDKGVFRVIYFVENIDVYDEVAWSFNNIFISKEAAGSKEEAEKLAVDALYEIEDILKEDDFEDNFDEKIDEVFNKFNKKDKDLAEKSLAKDVKSSYLIDEGHKDILDFLESSEEYSHNTFEVKDGFSIIINRGKKGISHDDEVLEFIRNLEEERLLKETYEYAEDFKLVGGNDKKPFLNINMDMYRANSKIEKQLLTGDKIKDIEDDKVEDESKEEVIDLEGIDFNSKEPNQEQNN